MKKILFVFGTRPEAIKLAPLIQGFKKYPELFSVKICVTAQHREMLDQVLTLFDIIPDFDFNIMKQNQNLYDITTNILIKCNEVFCNYTPDLVLVHGDTTTTFATALAAFYQKIPTAHIEAGLRTGNIYSPWPEEANRQLTSRIIKYHFAPTQLSKNNLLQEGINEKSICVTGNTVIDALFIVVNRINNSKRIENNLKKIILEKGYTLNDRRKFILITGHRRENFGEGFLNICKAIMTLASAYPEIDFIYPLHLNPNVRKTVMNNLHDKDNIYILPPLEYEPFIYLMMHSYIIFTDSGGIQEEAPGLGKPVLVMRDTTERPEAINAGTVKLVGTDKEKIVNTASQLINDKDIYNKMSKAHNPYGDGKATERIINFLRNNL